MRSKDQSGNTNEKVSYVDEVNEVLPNSYTFVPPVEVDIKKAQIPCAFSVSIPGNLHIFDC